MFSFLVCSALVAVSSAQYSIITGSGLFPYQTYASPLLSYPSYNTYIAPHTLPLAPVSSQYHSQDELGQFAFGHRSDLHARDEVKTADGTVLGSYSFVDATGKISKVEYKADHGGFQILGANNLPVAPVHLAEPVKDTPEVVAARADFARKFDEAKIAAEREPENLSRRRRDVFGSPFLTTIVKSSEFKTDEDAKTPASTKLAEIKETEKTFVTPYALPIHAPFTTLHSYPTTYSLGLDSYSYVPYVTPLEDKTLEVKPVEDKMNELKPVEDKIVIKDLKPENIQFIPRWTSPLVYPYAHFSYPLLKK